MFQIFLVNLGNFRDITFKPLAHVMTYDDALLFIEKYKNDVWQRIITQIEKDFTNQNIRDGEINKEKESMDEQYKILPFTNIKMFDNTIKLDGWDDAWENCFLIEEIEIWTPPNNYVLK